MYTIFSMWILYEHRRISKQLAKLPRDVLAKYEKWKDIVTLSGPKGLKKLPGLKDEALKGEWRGYRSSRLNQQYRVIYQIENDKVRIFVVNVNAHDYRVK